MTIKNTQKLELVELIILISQSPFFYPLSIIYAHDAFELILGTKIITWIKDCGKIKALELRKEKPPETKKSLAALFVFLRRKRWGKLKGLYRPPHICYRQIITNITKCQTFFEIHGLTSGKSGDMIQTTRGEELKGVDKMIFDKLIIIHDMQISRLTESPEGLLLLFKNTRFSPL